MKKLVAIKEIPGTVSIIPGQRFTVQDPEQEALWLRTGFARLDDGGRPKNSRGWDGLSWDGAEVVIMASGPSMSQEQADAAHAWALREPGRKSLAINTTFRLAPWADALYACDARWWRVYAEEVKASFAGQLWTQDQEAKAMVPNVVRSQRAAGLSREPGLINQGANSGYQGMNLAYQGGVRRMILLGFDMRTDGKKTHWHGDHPAPLNSANPYRQWVQNFQQLAADLLADGVEVINATPHSALRCFPMADWQEVLA